jgi:hypothetical protein
LCDTRFANRACPGLGESCPPGSRCRWSFDLQFVQLQCDGGQSSYQFGVTAVACNTSGSDIYDADISWSADGTNWSSWYDLDPAPGQTQAPYTWELSGSDVCTDAKPQYFRIDVQGVVPPAYASKGFDYAYIDLCCSNCQP